MLQGERYSSLASPASVSRPCSTSSVMTTAHVTVPKGVERIVLTLNNGEIEELRARLKDAEVCYRVTLPGCIVMRNHLQSSNANLTDQLTRLQSRYVELEVCLVLIDTTSASRVTRRESMQN